ncbi:MAG: flagellar biosynthetic protein FliO [Rhodocyclaceae bacterium]
MKPTLIRATPLLLILSPAAHAATETPSVAGSLLQMLLGLAVVLGALYGALRLLRKVQGNRQAGAGSVTVISATAVGPRERVVLVSVADKVLVLGVAPGRVNMLHTLDAEALPATPPPAPMAPLPISDFAARLKAKIEGVRRGR